MFSRVSFEKKKKTGYSGHRLTEIGQMNTEKTLSDFSNLIKKKHA